MACERRSSRPWKVPPFEQTLPDVSNPAFRVRLVLGPSGPGGICQEAPVLGLPRKPRVSLGCVASGPATAAKELSRITLRRIQPERPGGLPAPRSRRSGATGIEGLDERVAGVHQHRHQGPASGSRWSREPAEVYLCHCAGLHVGYADRGGHTAVRSLANRVLSEGRVGDPNPCQARISWIRVSWRCSSSSRCRICFTRDSNCGTLGATRCRGSARQRRKTSLISTRDTLPYAIADPR